MATTLDNIHEDLLFYNELKPFVFDSLTPAIDTHNAWLIEHGVIQVETLLELAISKVSGLVRESTMGKDFADGSDAKKVTSTWRNNNHWKGEWTNSYQVSGISNKRGTLRIMGYNRYASRFDYFAIPYYAYSHLKGPSLDIILDRYHGYTSENVPTPIGGSVYCKWNEFKEKSFIDMAKATY